VLPADALGQEGILVYLLAGTRSRNVMVLGRHYRVIVSEDGLGVNDVLPLSKSVIELPTQGEDGPAAALYVTHLITEYPLETHVLASLQHALPLFVSTSRGLWRVEGEGIAFLGNPSD